MYKIKNWEKFQQYKDRNPPWIKLHSELLHSTDWVMLSNDSRVLTIACMLLAAKSGADGSFSSNHEYIKRVCYLNSKPNFKPLLDSGFLEFVQDDTDCNQTVSSCTTEKRREETEKRQRREEIETIIDDLNLVLGTKYRADTKGTISLIENRIKKFTLEDFKIVHRKMLRSWGADQKMCKFLRPETLYGNKFEGYLNMKESQTILSNKSVDTFLIGKDWIKKEAENAEQKQIH